MAVGMTLISMYRTRERKRERGRRCWDACGGVSLFHAKRDLELGKPPSRPVSEIARSKPRIFVSRGCFLPKLTLITLFQPVILVPLVIHNLSLGGDSTNTLCVCIYLQAKLTSPFLPRFSSENIVWNYIYSNNFIRFWVIILYTYKIQIM